MRQVSSGFVEASLSPVSNANAYLDVNGTIVGASGITEITINENIGASGSFTVGTFNTADATITVLNSKLPGEVAGMPIKIYFGYYVGNAYEYVPMGIFYAQPRDISKKNLFTTIRAHDKSWRMTQQYVSALNWSSSHTAREVLNEIATAAEVTLGSFGGLNPSNVTVYEAPKGSHRDVIAQMALLTGTNAKINRTGSIDFIRAYPSSPVEEYGAYNYTSDGFSLTSNAAANYGKLTVNYKHMVGEEEQTTTYNYTAGSGANTLIIESTNVRTQAQTNTLGQTILSTGLSYYGYSASLPGQPQIDLGDTISIEGIFGETNNLLVLQATHSFNGAMKSTFGAVVNDTDPEMNGGNISGSITEQVATITDATSFAVGKAEFAATKADEAAASADAAATSASNAATSASNAEISAGNAATSASNALSSATQAASSASAAASSASAAATSAQNAANDAADANTYANAALDQLGIVQDVIGVLEWASTHGTFTLTTDTTVQEHKVYFTYNSSTGDYEPVTVAEGNPRQQGYYELSMTEAMQEFILAHLAVTTRGLWVLPNGLPPTNKTIDNTVDKNTSSDTQTEKQANANARQADNYKVLLSNNGMYVYDETGVAVSTYGENITFSATRPQSIGNANAGISFNPDNGGTITITGATINLGVTTLDQYLQGLTDRADEIDTIIRAYDDGVLTAKVDNEIGTLVNADGSFDIVNLTWTDDVPTIGSTVARYSASGVVIYDTNGVPIAQYGQTAIMGNPASFHIEASDTEMGLYEGDTKVAYINNDRLYIPQAAATNEVCIGNKWTWKFDDNDDSLYLKWI